MNTTTTKSFSSQLQDIKTQLGNGDKELNAESATFTQNLRESDISKFALKTGDKIPLFSLPDAKGNIRSIESQHTKEWLIISFYRGQWCPFCNLELRELEKFVTEFLQDSANLVAISPQTPDLSLQTVMENNLSYNVLSDMNCVIADKFRLVYTVPNYLHKIYIKNGLNIELFNGEGQLKLPMPATYVIDKKGVIRYHFVSEYAYERLDPKKIVQFIKQQAKGS